MSKLVWDKSGERYYETGTDRGVLYVQAADGTYPKGVVWNGITAVTESPSGAETTDLWADNIKYASLRSAETFGCTIEAYTYPDEFMECDGSKEVAPGVYIGQQSRNTFGFSYRTKVGNDTATESDDGYKLHLVYGATASPSEKAYQTVNDSPEAITLSWEVETTPVNVEIPGEQEFKPTATLTLNTLKMSAAAIKEIEDILYGTVDQEARLPLPAEVIQIMAKYTVAAPPEDIPVSISVSAPNEYDYAIGSTGKTVGDLQEGVYVDAYGNVYGTLKSVDDFTEYEDPTTGHFLCLQVSNVGTDSSATLTYSLSGSETSDKDVSEDKICVAITDPQSQQLTITGHPSSGVSGDVTKTLYLNNLTLQ